MQTQKYLSAAVLRQIFHVLGVIIYQTREGSEFFGSDSLRRYLISDKFQYGLPLLLHNGKPASQKAAEAAHVFCLSCGRTLLGTDNHRRFRVTAQACVRSCIGISYVCTRVYR